MIDLSYPWLPQRGNLPETNLALENLYVVEASSATEIIIRFNRFPTKLDYQRHNITLINFDWEVNVSLVAYLPDYLADT
jgi:hypothetical protein